MQIILFTILFVGLFLLSRTLTSTITLFFVRLTRNDRLAIQILALLFLPGVIIHELGHFFLASILFVPTGEIEFLPQVQGNSVKLGSVQIGKTDFIRRFIIGIAPVLFGLGSLLLIFWFLSPSLLPVNWKTIVFLYVVFEIGNTMFSSSKDLEGVAGFIIFAVLLVSLMLFFHVQVFGILLYALSLSPVQRVMQVLNMFFVMTIGIDVVIIGMLHGLMRPFRK